MHSKITYYVPWPLDGTPPYTVYKVYEGEELPEKYVVGIGWIQDKEPLLGLMSGDLGPPDVVTEEQVLSIISTLETNGIPNNV